MIKGHLDKAYIQTNLIKIPWQMCVRGGGGGGGGGGGHLIYIFSHNRYICMSIYNQYFDEVGPEQEFCLAYPGIIL